MWGVLAAIATLAIPASNPDTTPTVADGSLPSGIDSLERAIVALEPKLALLHTSYLKTEAFDRDGSVRQRVNDGEILHLLGDHGRATVLLFDMDVAIQRLGAENATHPSVVSLTGVYHNLLRQWAEM